VQPLLTYGSFSALPPFEKVEYLETFLSDVAITDKKNVFRLLRDIVEGEDNAYLKGTSLSILSQLTSQSFFPVEQILSVIQGEISNNGFESDRFILVKAIKFLYLFDTGSNNRTLIEKLTFHEDAEVSSEAYYRLGLMELLRYPLSNEADFLDKINLAHTKFDHASRIVENRVDALYFKYVTDFLISILSNDSSKAKNNLQESLNLLWKLKIFDFNSSIRNFEYEICRSMNSLLYLQKSLSIEKLWVNYQNEIEQIFYHHFELLAQETELNTFYSIQVDNLKKSTHTILAPLYKYNLSASKAKIEILLKQSESTPLLGLSDFLKYLLEIIDTQSDKKKDSTALLVNLARIFPNEPIDDLQKHTTQLDYDNLPQLLEFISTKFTKLQTKSYKTGFPNGDEILNKLLQEIRIKIPNYSQSSLLNFEIPLSEVIRYVFRSMKDTKKIFPELYDDFPNKSEETFQNSLYDKLRSSDYSDYYQYEPNEIGGGRFDIFFNNGIDRFPIEIKKTNDIPTKSNILANYIAQVQSYTAVHNQLGIFVVYDLSPKQNTKNPVNDLRELFQLVNVSSYYSTTNEFPVFIISVIVPASKVKPSSLSKYS
jgi:hypothetical protein